MEKPLGTKCQQHLWSGLLLSLLPYLLLPLGKHWTKQLSTLINCPIRSWPLSLSVAAQASFCFILKLNIPLQIPGMPVDVISPYSLNLLWLSSLVASSWIPVIKNPVFCRALWPTLITTYSTLSHSSGILHWCSSEHLPLLSLSLEFVGILFPSLSLARSSSWPREVGVCHLSFLWALVCQIYF